ncbi:MAG: glycerophosphodiester phosphodiesterase family protein [Nannocystaceae bacterium]
MPRTLVALLALLAVSATAACAHHPRPTDHLFPEVTAMGHRGAAGLAPENTLTAFRKARSLGVAFELDTFIAGSGELIVLHDDELERLAMVPGRASELSLAYLRTLDFGAHFDRSFAGEPITTLDEVFAEIAGDVVINVEVKAPKGTDTTRLAAAVVATIEAHGLTDRVIITSFNPFLLGKIRAENPDIARGQLVATFADSDLRWYEKALLKRLAFNRRAVPDVLSVEHVMIDRRFLKKMHRRGYKVFAWTVNEAEEMDRLLELGVDGIITDFPDRLLEVMRARGLPTPAATPATIAAPTDDAEPRTGADEAAPTRSDDDAEPPAE